MFDKNTILALVIIGIILLLTPVYYRYINPPAPQSETPTEAPVTIPPVQEVEETTPPPEASPAPASVTATTILPALENLDSEYVHVETPLFSMNIGSNGKITSYYLNKYETYKGGPVSLATTDFHTGRPIGGFDLDFGQSVLESIGQVQFEKVRAIKTVENRPDSVILKSGNDTTALTLTYIFYPDRYGFDLVVNTKGFIPTAQQTYQIKWQGGVPVTGLDTLRDMAFSKCYAYIGD
ncbi:hypothetical protein KKB28_05505, partial [bacterium]|nr:hypothetical protein [bacterium]